MNEPFNPYKSEPPRPAAVIGKETPMSIALAIAIGAGASSLAYQMGKSESKDREITEFKIELKGDIKELKEALRKQELNVVQLCAAIRGCSMKK